MPKTNELDWDKLYKESQNLNLEIGVYEVSTMFGGKTFVEGYRVGKYGIHDLGGGSFVVDHIESGCKIKDVLPQSYALLLAYTMDKLCPPLKVIIPDGPDENIARVTQNKNSGIKIMVSFRKWYELAAASALAATAGME